MASGAVANAPPAGGANDVSLEEPKKMTREDWRKKKELEEQRKLGNAPAEVDEEGKYVFLKLLRKNVFSCCGYRIVVRVAHDFSVSYCRSKWLNFVF